MRHSPGSRPSSEATRLVDSSVTPTVDGPTERIHTPPVGPTLAGRTQRTETGRDEPHGDALEATV